MYHYKTVKLQDSYVLKLDFFETYGTGHSQILITVPTLILSEDLDGLN